MAPSLAARCIYHCTEVAALSCRSGPSRCTRGTELYGCTRVTVLPASVGANSRASDAMRLSPRRLNIAAKDEPGCNCMYTKVLTLITDW